jgi:oxygen-independent coproporphyrinogen-3 oxidase
MTSLYIHFPFCLQKCAYCDFCSTTDLSLVDRYLGELQKEIKLYSTTTKYSIINTIYLGGGTPSLLSPKQVAELIAVIKAHYRVASDVEITIEANPETVTENKLVAYETIGVNRLSIGVQSFQEKNLRYLGRIHSAQTAREAVAMATKIFENVSLDLMYCFPEQNEVELRADLAEAIASTPQHISCYELTYNPDTPLYADLQRRSDRDRDFYTIVKQVLATAGFKQYEISNYAKPGFESRHNLAYWSDQSYIGVGASAHGYDRETSTRWTNTDSIETYLQGNYVVDREKAQPIDRIMMGLRTTYGIPIEWIAEDKVKSFISRGWMYQSKQRLILTDEGQLMADTINLELL